MEQDISKVVELVHASADVQGTKFPTRVIPREMRLADLEPFQGMRYRYRGTMNTASISGFAKYVTDRCGDTTSCFVDAKRMSANAVFNLGTTELPGHADDTAVLTLDKTAPFVELLAVDGKKMPQKSVAEWLEDWRDNLEAIAQDGSDMDMKKAIATIRRVTISASRTQDHADSDFGASRSAMEEIEAKGKDGDLPRSFVFTCTPYEGLGNKAFYLRLSLITGDNPMFVLRIIKLESSVEEMAQEFRTLIESEIGSDVKMYVGTFTA